MSLPEKSIQKTIILIAFLSVIGLLVYEYDQINKNEIRAMAEQYKMREKLYKMNVQYKMATEKTESQEDVLEEAIRRLHDPKISREMTNYVEVIYDHPVKKRTKASVKKAAVKKAAVKKAAVKKASKTEVHRKNIDGKCAQVTITDEFIVYTEPSEMFTSPNEALLRLCYLENKVTIEVFK